MSRGVPTSMSGPNVTLTRRTLTITEPVTLTMSVAVTNANRKTVTIQTSVAGYYMLRVWLAPATGDLSESTRLPTSVVLPAFRVTDATGALSIELYEPSSVTWRLCATVVNKIARDELAWG